MKDTHTHVRQLHDRMSFEDERTQLLEECQQVRFAQQLDMGRSLRCSGDLLGQQKQNQRTRHVPSQVADKGIRSS